MKRIKRKDIGICWHSQLDKCYGKTVISLVGQAVLNDIGSVILLHNKITEISYLDISKLQGNPTGICSQRPN